MLASLAPSAVAQSPEEPAATEIGEIEEVVVVGTRRIGRSTANLPVPVDVLGQRELERHGYGDMLDALTSSVYADGDVTWRLSTGLRG